jgi:putative hydrolase of the HAD superfamily
VTRASVRTVFLDAGGVLVEPDWIRIARILARRGVDVTPGSLAAADPAAKRDLDLPGVIRTSDDQARGAMYYRAVLRRAGLPDRGPAADAAVDDLVADHVLYNLWSVVPPGVPGALDRLREAGLALVVVSNANGRLRHLFEDLGLAPRLDHVVDSGAIGVEKPDPRIFLEALRVSGARPESTVHVGDYYEIDVVGARAAGLRAVLLDPAGVHGDRDCERRASLAEFARSLLDPPPRG